MASIQHNEVYASYVYLRRTAFTAWLFVVIKHEATHSDERGHTHTKDFYAFVARGEVQ